LAAELIIDGIVPGDLLRAELVKRFGYYLAAMAPRTEKKHGVHPV
jgi:methylmalonyl-CoA decarboxylase subunit alpha